MKRFLSFFFLSTLPGLWYSPSFVLGLKRHDDEAGFLRHGLISKNHPNISGVPALSRYHSTFEDLANNVRHYKQDLAELYKTTVTLPDNSFPPGFAELLSQAIEELGTVEEVTSSLAWQRRLKDQTKKSLFVSSDSPLHRNTESSDTSHGAKHTTSPFQKTTNPRLRSMHMLEESILHGFYPRQRAASFHMPRSHRRRRLRRKLAQQQCDSTSLPGGAQKKCERCHELVKCVEDMTTYDLFVFFFGDDIDFDKGEMDDKITNFDAQDITQKRRQIMEKLESATAFLENLPDLSFSFFEGDPCDELLREFHNNVELDEGLGAKWVGSSDIDVCRGRGATEYISFKSLRDNGFYDESNAFFEDVVACTKVIHDLRPQEFTDEWKDEAFVFVNATDGILRVPIGICNGTTVLDEHGQVKVPVDIDALYKFSAVDFLAEHTVPEDHRDLLDGLAVRMREECYEKWGPDKDNWGCNKFNSYYSYEFWERLDNRGFDMTDYQERNYENLYLGCQRRKTGLDLNIWWQCWIAAKEPPSNSNTYSFQDLNDNASESPPNSKCYFEADGKYGSSQCDSALRRYAEEIGEKMDECDYKEKESLACNVVKVVSPLQQVNAENYDTAVSLIFGDQVSVGLICAYAEEAQDAAKEKEVGTDYTNVLPGTCCLDSPYSYGSSHEGEYWGKDYDCGRRDCQKYAPYLAGFSEDACAVFGGTWCPNPIDCSPLRDCVEDAKELAKANETRNLAFQNYLDRAPNLDGHETDRETCQEAKVYYGFDPDEPDQDLICEEILRLRGTRDFQKLDEFLHFSGGGGGGLGDDLREPKEATMLDTQSLQWRQEIQRVEVSYVNFMIVMEAVNSLDCGIEPVCPIIKNVASIVMAAVACGLANALAIHKYEYLQQRTITDEQHEQVYENVDVIYDNMVTTYNKLKEIDEKIDSMFGGELSGKYSGCDGFGNDDCSEDNWPPDLVIHPGIGNFVRLDDWNQFVLKTKAFQTTEDAHAFLGESLGVVDDCASLDQLGLDISLLPGPFDVAGRAKFEVVPVQNRPPPCNDELRGQHYDFTVQIDNVPPVVSCQFLTDSTLSSLSDSKKKLSKTGTLDRMVNGSFCLIGRAQASTVEFIDSFVKLYVNTENETAPVSVEVSVDSNELDPKAAEIFVSKEPADDKVLIKPTRCASGKSDSYCGADPAFENRFYDIHVTAIDVAGNVGTATCVVGIVALQGENKLTPELMDAFLEGMQQSTQRFQLAQISKTITPLSRA